MSNLENNLELLGVINLVFTMLTFLNVGMLSCIFIRCYDKLCTKLDKLK